MSPSQYTFYYQALLMMRIFVINNDRIIYFTIKILSGIFTNKYFIQYICYIFFILNGMNSGPSFAIMYVRTLNKLGEYYTKQIVWSFFYGLSMAGKHVLFLHSAISRWYLGSSFFALLQKRISTKCRGYKRKVCMVLKSSNSTKETWECKKKEKRYLYEINFTSEHSVKLSQRVISSLALKTSPSPLFIYCSTTNHSSQYLHSFIPFFTKIVINRASQA